MQRSAHSCLTTGTKPWSRHQPTNRSVQGRSQQSRHQPPFRIRRCGDACKHVEFLAPVGIHVFPNQRGERLLGTGPLLPLIQVVSDEAFKLRTFPVEPEFLRPGERCFPQ